MPRDLPHGPIAAPPEVLDQVAARVEELRLQRGIEVTEAARMRAVNQQTLQAHFGHLGRQVAYRETPEGPDVLAVGFEEILALTEDMSPREQEEIGRWLPA